ncbi:hypothetical protein C9374_009049 [Naegleria lovaniensis]|uniref:Uncharacterized protein n=1 Tax=Naegleria lovaniensis TaxID=51637 RepID=A0AA88KH74_NAELO|nr:uncharacterized protein C9374_009049 [Naegleria lovaniensis]KAG2377533.1 hypothetical protein C9374_009049 [Naegleria lovaniensis]
MVSCLKSLLFCCLLLSTTLLQTVLSQNPSSCSIEKNGMIIDLSKADNGTFGWIIQDYIPGSFYNVNPCNPAIPTNNTFCAFNAGAAQIFYTDNYFHRCIAVGKAGPKISLFDPNNIEHGLVVDFDLFPGSNGGMNGAQLFMVCDENVHFDGHFIGKSKKFLKEQYIYNFKIITKYACPRKHQQQQQKKGHVLFRGLN